MLVAKQLTVIIGFRSMEKIKINIIWKSVATVNCLVSKYRIFYSKQEIHSYRFGTNRIVIVRIVIFEWTIPLNKYQCY